MCNKIIPYITNDTPVCDMCGEWVNDCQCWDHLDKDDDEEY